MIGSPPRTRGTDSDGGYFNGLGGNGGNISTRAEKVVEGTMDRIATLRKKIRRF